MTTADVPTAQAVRAPQFYLLWLVLVCNTTAGIGILEQAVADDPGDVSQAQLSAIDAGGGERGERGGSGRVSSDLISLFNLLGRFFWSASSDFVGRKNTVAIFLGHQCGHVLPDPHCRRDKAACCFSSWSAP